MREIPCALHTHSIPQYLQINGGIVKLILVSGQCLLQTVWEQEPLVTMKKRTYVAFIKM